MFLFERLIGVGIYASVLVFVCLLLNGTGPKTQRKILFLYNIALSVMAYFYVPYETADLYRILGYVEDFQRYSFSMILDYAESNSNIGIAAVLYWLVGKTGYPHLLPAIVTFICYSCIFYIIRKTAEKNAISGKNVSIALFFYMTTETFISIVGGIRCMLGVSLLALCFYRETVEHKFNVFHIPLYFISFFIHSFSAILVIMRFIIPVFNTKKAFVTRLIYSLFLGVGTLITIQYLGDYLANVVSKAESYINGDNYSYFWGYIIDAGAWIVMFSVLKRYCRYKNNNYIVSFNGLRLYLLLCLIVPIFFYYEYSIFTRFILHISPIICIPLLMIVLQKNDETRNAFEAGNHIIHSNASGYNSLFLIASILLLLLSCSRGEMSSLKFFVL